MTVQIEDEMTFTMSKMESIQTELAELWAETTGDPNICVAILDGPVDLSHPCFAGSQLKIFSEGSASQGMASQHGTHIASVIFGQHGSSVLGVAPGCRGLIIPIFSERDDGSIITASQLDLARAITQAVENGAHIINISGGELKSSGEADPILAKAIRYCAEKGVLIVAAAGNDGCQCLHVPASIASTLAVGAMNAQGAPLTFSNWGEAYQTHGILAPGQDIAGAAPGGGVALKTGTSFATPIVSGVAALLLSIQVKHGLKPNVTLVREAILRGSTACIPHKELDCRRFLVGSLNVKGAYQFVKRAGGVAQSKLVSINSSDFGQKKGEKQAMTVQEIAPENVNALEWPTTSEQSVHHDPAQAEDCLVCKAQVSPADLSMAKTAFEQNNAANSSDPVLTEGDTSQLDVTEDEAGIGLASATPSAEEISNVIYSNDANEAAGFQSTNPTKEKIMESQANNTINQQETKLPDQISAEKGPILLAQTAAQLAPSEVLPAGCGDSTPPALTYALGTLGYDFVNEARRDSFIQAGLANPDDPNQFLTYLDENPYMAADVIWTLNLDATPIYAIKPNGAYAGITYDRLREFLQGQIDPDPDKRVERISVPGYSGGKVALMSGEQVPWLVPDLRGMYSWSMQKLIDASVQGTDAENQAVLKEKLRQFLERIYYEMRNLGITSQDRALNYVGTNVYQALLVLESKINSALNSITTEASPFCRPGSDCWDVILTFFNPDAPLMQSQIMCRFTVDVSDTIPVTIGPVRSWPIA